MAGMGRRAAYREINAWPGWVDALSSLVMVVIFLLMIFVVSQFFLTVALTGRERQIDTLGVKMAELGEMLAMERKTSSGLRGEISLLNDQMQASIAARAEMTRQMAGLQDERDTLERQLQDDQRQLGRRAVALARSETAIQERDAKLGEAAQALDQSRAAFSDERKLSTEARVQVALLNQQIAALRDQLGRLGALLDASERKSEEQGARIADLGGRLNQALASKVQELARYRSEFFGRLREALGNRPDIRVVGDRFVFQSEVLFATGSAALEEGGKQRLDALAKTLAEVARAIPSDINWILRVDGHTDVRPINSPQFPSNWELSAARAISVVKALVEQGIPADHLAAAGFGEYQPLESGPGEEALARNRRIEIKLDQR